MGIECRETYAPVQLGLHCYFAWNMRYLIEAFAWLFRPSDPEPVKRLKREMEVAISEEDYTTAGMPSESWWQPDAYSLKKIHPSGALHHQGLSSNFWSLLIATDLFSTGFRNLRCSSMSNPKPIPLLYFFLLFLCICKMASAILSLTLYHSWRPQSLTWQMATCLGLGNTIWQILCAARIRDHPYMKLFSEISALEKSNNREKAEELRAELDKLIEGVSQDPK